MTVPAYNVRVNPKAKHPRLKISAKDDLTVLFLGIRSGSHPLTYALPIHKSFP